MAQGDITVFNKFKEDIGDKLLDLSGDTFKLGLVDNTTVPSASTADPRWGTGGTTDFSANEVTPGGNYPAGGVSLSAVITDNWTISGGTATFDGDDVSIAKNASNPSGAYWGIIYDSTDTGKRAIAFIDLAGPIDLSAGDFTITWNASGIFSIP